MCWKSIFFKSLQFFQGRIIWITFGWGALGAETLCLSGVKICPWNTLGGNLGGQVENVCPLGAEKGQNLPSSALRQLLTYCNVFCTLFVVFGTIIMFSVVFDTFLLFSVVFDTFLLFSVQLLTYSNVFCTFLLFSVQLL